MKNAQMTTKHRRPGEMNGTLFEQLCEAIADMRTKRAVATFQVFLQEYTNPADIEAMKAAKYIYEVTDTELEEWKQRYETTYGHLDTD